MQSAAINREGFGAFRRKLSQASGGSAELVTEAPIDALADPGSGQGWGSLWLVWSPTLKGTKQVETAKICTSSTKL